MKSLVAVIALLGSFSAFAGEISEPDSVYFQAASTYVPADKVCRDGNYLRHKTKSVIEVSYCSNDAETNCDVVSKKLVQPVVGVAKRCVKTSGREGSRCLAWETYPLDQSTYNVTVYSSSTAQERSQGGRVKGPYSFPDCR